MADKTHHKMAEGNPGRLARIVTVLAMTYVATFLGGFLQATQLNFLNYIFFLLLSIGGIRLLSVTVKSKATGITKGFFLLTGICAIFLAIFFLGYEWSRLRGLEDLEVSIEAILYLVTLLFWIAVIGSLALIRRRKGLNSSQS